MKTTLLTFSLIFSLFCCDSDDNPLISKEKIDTNSPVVQTPPLVSLSALGSINSTNSDAFTISGTCSVPGGNLLGNLGAISFSAICAEDSTFTIDVNSNSIADTSVVVLWISHFNLSGPVFSSVSMVLSKDTVRPSVTAEQESGQSDPSSGTTIIFDVVFSKAIDPLSFSTSDVTQTGTLPAGDISWLITNSGDNQNFTLTATLTGGFQGTVIPTISEGNVLDGFGNENLASTSLDNSVSFGVPGAITPLLYTGRCTGEIEVGWSAPTDNGFPITDYIIEFKESALTDWNIFPDGVSNDTRASITGLSDSTDYDFRVSAFNGLQGLPSDVLVEQTPPNTTFFSCSNYSYINIGASTGSVVAAMDDTTTVTLPDTSTVSLDSGDTQVLGGGSVFDIVTADKPIFVAGEVSNSNFVWNPSSLSGKEFIVIGTRSPNHTVRLFAFEAADISVFQDGVLIPGFPVSILANSSHTFSVGNGTYEISSTALIAGFQLSGASDPHPLIPSSKDLIGFPSGEAQIGTFIDSNPYTYFHSDGVTGPGTVDRGVHTSLPSSGANSLYTGVSTRIISTEFISARSNADGDGSCAAPFLPASMQKRRYVIPVTSEWVTFASTEPGVIEIIAPVTGTITTVALARVGSGNNDPYRARLTNKAAGTIFRSLSGGFRFAAWYEPSTNTNAGNDDESILFGSDD